MSIKEIERQISALDKSLKGETDLSVILWKWGQIIYLTNLIKGENNYENVC